MQSISASHQGMSTRVDAQIQTTLETHEGVMGNKDIPYGKMRRLFSISYSG